MHLLLHIVVGLALTPGSLILAAVLLWRAARAATGFKRPTLPLVSRDGLMLCSAADWHRHAREATPVQYALFETLPKVLRRAGRAFVETFSLRSTRDAMLIQSFRLFASWVDANLDLINASIFQLDDFGPTQQELVRRAEIRSLYDWWTNDRPRAVRGIEDLDLDDRVPYVLHLEEDDQLYFARLANLWRTLT